MKRQWIEPGNATLSIVQQVRLASLPRATYYYKPVPISERDQHLMREIDGIYTRWPFFGARRISFELKQRGHCCGRRHTGTLMSLMGLEAIYPRKRLSIRNPEHKVFPYLLRNVQIDRPNQVWSTDITYIRLNGGFVYLVAVMDWRSRYVLSWRLSNTLDGSFCREALSEALEINEPEIFNSDQGSQFTDGDFIKLLERRGIKISMDGKGRALDNVFVERLWRTVKYEEVYLKNYENIQECLQALTNYFNWYNRARPHQSLKYKTPEMVYFGTGALAKAS
jgi:putative transposase